MGMVANSERCGTLAIPISPPSSHGRGQGGKPIRHAAVREGQGKSPDTEQLATMLPAAQAAYGGAAQPGPPVRVVARQGCRDGGRLSTATGRRAGRTKGAPLRSRTITDSVTAMTRLIWFSVTRLCGFAATLAAAMADDAAKIIPPEVVQVAAVNIAGDIKYVTVSNDMGSYRLMCNIHFDGCITPEPGARYYLFNKNTYWKIPGAKDFISLKWVQDWTGTYKGSENVALVPDETSGAEAGLGVFVLV